MNNKFFTFFIFFPLFLLGFMNVGWGQTNPTAQNLPYSQDFSSLNYTSTTYPVGWQGWTISTTPGASFNTAAPTADKTLIASGSASSTTAGVYNYNGKIGFLNGSSLDEALILSISTTGFNNILFQYDIMTIRNPYDGSTNTRINEVTLQYRVGTSGTFTNLTGIEYQNNTTIQTGSGVTTPQNSTTKTIILPPACDNQSVVQLRWASRQVSGGGSRPSFAVDNLILNYQPTTQVSSINFTTVAHNSMTVNWTFGNGTFRAVFVRQGDQGTITNPTNGTTYTPSANWTSKGTQLGTSGYYCVYNGTGTSVDLTNLAAGTTYWVQAFEYIGSGTTSNYLTSTATDNPKSQMTANPNTPIISISPSSLTGFSYSVGHGPSSEQNYVVNGLNLSSDLIITPPTHFEISLTSGSGFSSNPITLSPSGGTVSSTTIYVRLIENISVGTYNENIENKSTDATTQNLSCNGSVTKPSISINPSTLNDFTYTTGNGPSTQQTFSVSGTNLIDNILITPSANYEISKSSGTGFTSNSITLTQSGGTVSSTTIYVRLKSNLPIGTYNELIPITSSEAETQTLSCNGAVTVTKMITLNPTSLSGFTYLLGSGPSTEKSYTVSGTGLTDNIVITPSTHYEISQTSGSGFTSNGITLIQTDGTVNETTLYVRLKSNLFLGTYNETITLSSTGITTQYLSCNGSVTTNIVVTNTGYMSDFPDWTFTNCTQGNNSANYYIQMLSATSKIVTPTLDLSNSSFRSLSFSARTYGGPSIAQSTITVSISTDNGTNWTVMGTRVPTSTTLSSMDPFDLSPYLGTQHKSGTQVQIKFETLGASGSKGVGIDDIGSESPMPVTLKSLTSNVAGRNINLKWVTSEEINNAGFDVERKQATGEYVKVGFVKGSGTVTSAKSYEFTDRNLMSGKYSYRLKQIDNNGNFEYFTLTGDAVVGVPVKFDLSQNYPNPFNPATKINFDLPKDSKLSLKLYDMLGREVSTLVNEFRTAGYYTVDFNASSLSSGIYFYRLLAGEYNAVKKLVVVK